MKSLHIICKLKIRISLHLRLMLKMISYNYQQTFASSQKSLFCTQILCFRILTPTPSSFCLIHFSFSSVCLSLSFLFWHNVVCIYALLFPCNMCPLTVECNVSLPLFECMYLPYLLGSSIWCNYLSFCVMSLCIYVWFQIVCPHLTLTCEYFIRFLKVSQAKNFSATFYLFIYI